MWKRKLGWCVCLIVILLVMLFMPFFVLQGKVLETNFLLLFVCVCAISLFKFSFASMNAPGISELSLEEGYGKQFVNCAGRIGLNYQSLRFYVAENGFNNMQVRGERDVVLLADKRLLELLEEEEREGLFLHELCHVIKKDQLKKIMLWVGYTAVVVNILFLCRQYDKEILWVALLVVVSVGLYLVSFFQKRIELRADLFAIDNGCEPAAYITMLKKIVPQREGISLSHPALKKRIEYILNHTKTTLL